MGKRKAKVESSDEEVVDLDDDASDSDYVVEEKPKRSRTQSASPRKSPAKKRPPPRPKVTEVETQPDGFVLYPPSLIYRCSLPFYACMHVTVQQCCKASGHRLKPALKGGRPVQDPR